MLIVQSGVGLPWRGDRHRAGGAEHRAAAGRDPAVGERDGLRVVGDAGLGAAVTEGLALTTVKLSPGSVEPL